MGKGWYHLCAIYARFFVFLAKSAKKICTFVEGHVMKEQWVNENIRQERLKNVHSSTLSHPHWGEKRRQNEIVSTLIHYYL